MKYMIASLVLGVVFAAVLVGCTERTPTSDEKYDKARQEVGEAVDAVGDYSQEKKEEIMNSLEENLAELDKQMEAMKEKGKSLADDARQKWNERKSDLEAQRAALRKRMDELKDSSGEAWKELREGANSAWKELKTAFDKAATELFP